MDKNRVNESKEERFKRIVSKRVQKILDGIRLLGNCSNTAIYSYTRQDIQKIFTTIENKIKNTKSLFILDDNQTFKL